MYGGYERRQASQAEEEASDSVRYSIKSPRSYFGRKTNISSLVIVRAVRLAPLPPRVLKQVVTSFCSIRKYPSAFTAMAVPDKPLLQVLLGKVTMTLQPTLDSAFSRRSSAFAD